MNIEQIIDFLKMTEKFKTCERTCRTTNLKRAESNAEHSWHLCLFLLLLEKELGDIDFLRLLKIALIHDLPEILAGDTNPYRGDIQNKALKEKAAADKLFSLLPEALEAEMRTLFDEYVRQETPESKIAKSADKLLPLIQNLCTNDIYSSYRALKVTHEEVVNYMDPYFLTDDILSVLYRRLLNESDRRGVFHPPEKKNTTAAGN
ncbi:MAG: HD domain-containing protein [Pseudomonadota bacterium]